MLDDPLLHFDGQPKAVNAQRDDGQKKPFDVVAEQLTARAVKGQSLAVNDRVAREPALLDANGPRHTDAKGNTTDQPLQQIDTDQTDQASRKFRFHINLHSAAKASAQIGMKAGGKRRFSNKFVVYCLRGKAHYNAR